MIALSPSRRPPLTERQQQVLDFIRATIRRTGASPSFREIAEEIGVGKTAAFNIVRAIEAKGYVTHEDYERRAIRIVPEERQLLMPWEGGRP